MSHGHQLPNRYGDDTRNTFALYGGAHWSTFDSIKGAFGGVRRGSPMKRLMEWLSRATYPLAARSSSLISAIATTGFAAGRLNSPLVGINSETYPSPDPLQYHPRLPGLGLAMSFSSVGWIATIRFYPAMSGVPAPPILRLPQLGFTFDNGFELAINRLFMFGGGERSVEGGDFLQAFFDPAAADNPVQSSCTGPRNLCEFGNQLLTLSTSARLDYRGTPFHIHAMIGAEDTARGSNDHLGNMLMGFGLELPWLSADSQLGVDYAEFEAGWYIHHVYRDGYTHNGRIAGAGWGDFQGRLRGLPGEAVALLWVKRLSLHNELSLRLDHLRVGTPEGSEYADQLIMDWRSYTDTQRLSGWNMALILGDDIDDNRYAQVRFGYEW